MTRDEKPFDELIREKLNQRSFEPGPGSWEKAETLIRADEERKKSRFRGAFILFFALAAAGAAGIYYVAETGKRTADNGASSGDPKIVSWQNTRAAGSSGASQTPDLAGEKPAAPGTSSHGANANANEKSNASSSSSVPGNEISAPAENSDNPKQQPAEPVSSTGKKDAGHTSREKTGVPVKASAAAHSGAGTKSGSHATKNNRGIDTALAAHHPGAAEQTGDGQLPQSGADTTARQFNAQPQSDTMTTQQLVSAQPAGDSVLQQTPATADSTKQRTVMNPDSTHETPSVTNSRGGSVHYWFLEAGMNFLPGFSGLHRSFNPVIGGGYCIHLGKSTSLQLGLNYTFLNHVSDSSVVYTSATYSFGVERQRTEIGLRRLHYVSMPVSFRYHFNDRHALFGGVTLNYLLATESRERSYTDNGSSITDEQVRPVFGYGQGISRFDVLLAGGYARSFGPHWSLQAAVYGGLIDLKDNSWYGVNTFERNCGLRFTLQYGF